MPENEVHDQVLQLKPGAPGVGQHMSNIEQKSEIFCAQFPERYTWGGKLRCAPNDSRDDA